MNWRVTIDGTESTAGLGFAIMVNGTTHSRGAAPPVACQVIGSALITVDDVPATLYLRNISGDTVTCEDIAIQANIVIMK